MSELVFREAYWGDMAARRAFQRFLVEIHGLDLHDWEAAGYWDDDYRPFSYFDGQGRVVSSVCCYSLETVLRGSRSRAAQISGVGTAPERRRLGLNRELTERALEWARRDHEFVFLFSDQDAVPFYERCGFLPQDQQMPHVRVSPREPRAGMRALDVDLPADREQLLDRATRRAGVSSLLGVLNPKLFMFHALYTLRGLLFEIPELGLVIALRRDAARVTILDLVGPRIPRFEEIYPYLASPRTTEVAFHFVPDALALPEVQWHALPGDNLHVREGFPLRGERFLFPFTAHA
jgi:GNAT superfamily N-acetyltransferase